MEGGGEYSQNNWLRVCDQGQTYLHFYCLLTNIISNSLLIKWLIFSCLLTRASDWISGEEVQWLFYFVKVAACDVCDGNSRHNLLQLNNRVSDFVKRLL